MPIRSLETGKVRSISLHHQDEAVLFTPQGDITVDSFIAAKSMLMANWGIVGLAEWMIQKELKSGEVVHTRVVLGATTSSLFVFHFKRLYATECKGVY
ncbi:hypothetical protein JCM19231_3216 [Vibrio ishigakensis]|uniref:Uncharacterized protein n=1 Tax=Vibrio ishigakensis TaxID=1481914 RepID=A0A0B8P364_9VIBR|nr:hypothetical protein JCM19231_3216 [Vibrio ishigakensis]